MLLFSIHSIGMGTSDVKWLAGLGFLLLGIKIVITDYTRKEIAKIVVALFMGGLPLGMNADKLLLLSIITIIAMKNCEYRKIFLWAAVSRAILIAGKMGLVSIGVLPNDYNDGLVKYSALTGESVNYSIPNFGYAHPNFLYLGAVSIALLLILFYRDKMRWYGYAIITAVLYALYRVIYCRTGLYLWICILAMILLYRLICSARVKKIYLSLLTIIPLLLSAATIVFSYYQERNSFWAQQINAQFSGRFEWWKWKTMPLWQMILPQSNWLKLDNGYWYCVYNFGWLIMLLLFGWIIYTQVVCIRKGADYEPLMLTATCGYLIGEATPLSSTWNPCILLLAIGIYGLTEGKATNVPKGIID